MFLQIKHLKISIKSRTTSVPGKVLFYHSQKGQELNEPAKQLSDFSETKPPERRRNGGRGGSSQNKSTEVPSLLTRKVYSQEI